MKLLARFALSIFSNTIAILGADYFLKDFIFKGDFVNLITAALILTGINIFIRPIIKLLMGPFIILTLGLAFIAVNILAVYLLDFFSETITINGLMPLAISSLVIGAVNFFVNFSAKALYK